MIEQATVDEILKTLRAFFPAHDIKPFPGKNPGEWDLEWSGWEGPIPWTDLVAGVPAVLALLPDDVRVFAESDTRLGVYPRMIRLDVIE